MESQEPCFEALAQLVKSGEINERQRSMMELYFFAERFTIEEVGKQFHVSGGLVSQQLAKVARKVRKPQARKYFLVFQTYAETTPETRKKRKMLSWLGLSKYGRSGPRLHSKP